MGNVLQALALALGGGARGVAGGLDDIETHRLRQQNMELEKQRLNAEVSWRQQQSAFQHQQLSETERHNTVEEQSRAENQFSQNADRLGVNFMNPHMAMQALNSAPPSSAGISTPTNPIGMATQAVGNYQGAQQRQGDFYKAADAAGQSAMNRNQPRAYVPNSEQYGGAFAQGKPFNPNSSVQSALIRAGTAEDGQFQRMIMAARAKVEAAYTNELSSWARNNGLSDISQLVNDPGMAQVRRKAEASAHARQAESAQSEFSILSSMWPDRMMGLSPGSFMNGGSTTSTPAPNPSGARVTSPTQRQGPGLNFNPNDPLGIYGPKPAAPAQQSNPAKPSNPVVSAPPNVNDPLGLYKKP